MKNSIKNDAREQLRWNDVSKEHIIMCTLVAIIPFCNSL